MCGETKPLTEYNKKRASGVQPYCRPCQSIYQRDDYEKNLLPRKDKIYTTRQTRKVAIRKLLADFYAQNPCVDCGETDLLVLEFDHVTGKEFGINHAIRDTIAIDRIIEELKKGEVRCANCHRRITAENSNSWRWKYVNGIPLDETEDDNADL
jgi:hypothetical protein